MAISLRNMGVGISKWASGVSWQLLLFKLTACAAVLTLTAIGFYREGKADAELEQATKAISTLTTERVNERNYIREQLRVQQVEIQNRLNVINTQSREAQQLRTELAQIRGRLDEAINSRPANAACAPSADELREYAEIAERTRQPNRR